MNQAPSSDPAFWRDRPTFVTGATGLVGGWVVKRLVELGADVVCLVRDWVPESELVRSRAIEKVRVVRGDVRDQALLERALGEYEIATVMHLAAQTIVGIANRNPVSTFETNIGGTWALLEACRRSPKVSEIVVASSDKAYGEAKVLPYDESTALDGVHPYDASKSCTDIITRSYASTWGVPAVTTRCGNFFGGGDLNWNRIVPGTIRSIVRNERPIIRSDGKFTRDYFYVEDGAAAYTLVAEKLGKDRSLKGHAFNLSYEKPITVLELVDRVSKAMGSKLEPVIENQASNEIREQYLDAKKARTMLDWAPTFALDEGLARTIRWYREHLA
ncbi:MAG: GDP-mannose 4,6-dehydratase [Labilithrix sp.]|nr:GDP-mannose 4,6-dehydratase [Labilithrix sp.]MCW5816964.1 GDP-mannose 4,6-dehydratase [Labilithrix sp.]